MTLKEVYNKSKELRFTIQVKENKEWVTYEDCDQNIIHKINNMIYDNILSNKDVKIISGSITWDNDNNEHEEFNFLDDIYIDLSKDLYDERIEILDRLED